MGWCCLISLEAIVTGQKHVFKVGQEKSQNSLGTEALHIGVSKQSFELLTQLNDTQLSFPKMQNTERELASRLRDTFSHMDVAALQLTRGPNQSMASQIFD